MDQLSESFLKHIIVSSSNSWSARRERERGPQSNPPSQGEKEKYPLENKSHERYRTPVRTSLKQQTTLVHYPINTLAFFVFAAASKNFCCKDVNHTKFI